MAWSTPKTNWTSGDFCTYVDMNRIVANIKYLYNEIGIAELYPSMMPVMTANGTLTYTRCNQIQEEVYQLYGLLGCTGEYPFIFNKTINSSPWSSTDLNTIESILLECKNIVDSGDYSINLDYAGTELYADNDSLL